MTIAVYAFNDKRQVDMILSLGKKNLLVSYYYLNQKKNIKGFLEHIIKETKREGVFILDSGAYSAWKSGFNINLWDYIDFIKQYHEYFTDIVCLDVIDNPIYSEVNHRIMLRELDGLGLTIIPVFHAGEPFTVLDYMIEQSYSYIGISPNNDWREQTKREWLKVVYSRYDFDKLGVRTHGFGYQSTEGLTYFPMTTADAITWKIAAGYGRIMCPINPSVRYSDVAIGEPDHIDSIPGGHSQFTLEVCEFLGINVDQLRTEHDTRSAYNIEAIDRLLSMPKKDFTQSINQDIFLDDVLETLTFDLDELEKVFLEVNAKGREYKGTPDIIESSNHKKRIWNANKIKSEVVNSSLF